MTEQREKDSKWYGMGGKDERNHKMRGNWVWSKVSLLMNEWHSDIGAWCTWKTIRHIEQGVVGREGIQP